MGILWNKTNIFLDTQEVLPEKNWPYDFIVHQARVVTSQTNTTHNEITTPSMPAVALFKTIMESFIDYFNILIAYCQRPQFYSELIARDRFISTGKIINLYLVGLVCSVSIPAIISVGSLNAENLTFFSSLPPFVADICQFLLEFLILFFIAGSIHLLAHIKGHKGKFGTMIRGTIFIWAFLQLIARPYFYLSNDPLEHAVKGDLDLYNKISTNFLGPLFWLLTAYFLYPLCNAIYKVSRTLVVFGYSIPLVVLFVLQMIFAGESLSIHGQTNLRLQALTDREKEILSICEKEVIPAEKFGAETGHYTQLIIGLRKCSDQTELLMEDSKTLNAEIKQQYPYEHMQIAYSDLLCRYFNARIDFYHSVERYDQKQMPEDVFSGVVKKLIEKRDSVNMLSLSLR